MKYIRTKDGQVYYNLDEDETGVIVEWDYLGEGLDLRVNHESIIAQADTIEELIQVGDLVFVIYSSDDYKKENPILIHDNFDLGIIKKGSIITKLFVPFESGFKLIAISTHAFKTFKGLRTLVGKGELELI